MDTIGSYYVFIKVEVECANRLIALIPSQEFELAYRYLEYQGAKLAANLPKEGIVVMMTELIGASRNIERTKELIVQVANSEVNTIVTGETGVGKELIVQNLYRMSARNGKPIVKVNCSALPENLLESEMFGYEKGAFTGANGTKRGKFEQANGGVLFLDEIGDMSLELQAKLLRVLQDGEYTPLGSEKTISTDAWVIAATNQDLEQDMATGKFRKDLFYRLSTVIIHVEALRNRTEDIPVLINYYFKKYASSINNGPPRILSKATMEKLMGYPWPGNVRELQNVLQRLLVLNASDSDVDEIISNRYCRKSCEGRQPPIDPHSEDHDRSLRDKKIPLKHIKKKVFQKIEKELIAFVLEKTFWNRSKASEILEISYKSLLTKIDEFGLNPNQVSDGPKFKYLTAMEEAGFVDSAPEVFQFVNAGELEAVPQSGAN
jgi:transcriptional regulator with GAF, ATPase, and Fis domain